jgi:hypothetical protein
MLILMSIALGLLLGAASSWATHKVSTTAGIAVGAFVVVLAFAVIAMQGETALFPMLGVMLAFAFMATLLDSKPKGLFR